MQEKNQKRNNKVLCLSFWTPPIVRPQSILIGKMIPEWMKQGISAVIVTYDICGKWNIGVPTYTVPQAGSKNRFWSLPFIRLIDEYFYYRKLLKIGMKAVKENDVKSIFSFSNPQSSNTMGAMLKKRLGLPFVAYMSDPWYDNHYKPLKSLGAWKTYLMERFVIKTADKIIFTNEEARKLVMKKYPQKWQEKSLVISHCFDPRDYEGLENKKQAGKFIISYIGAFYKERNPGPLFEALKIIKKTRPELSSRIELHLVGAENTYAGYSKEALHRMIETHDLKNSALVFPSVEYKKSLEFMKNSDCLVVIDANIPDSPYLPSKVIDYAGAKVPIISITPKGSPTEEAVVGLGFKSFTYDEIQKLALHIVSLVEGKNLPQINETFLQQFHVRETTKKLLSHLSH